MSATPSTSQPKPTRETRAAGRSRELLDQVLAETFGRRLLPDDLVGRLKRGRRRRQPAGESWRG